MAHPGDHRIEAAEVRLVERCIDFVEYAEGRRAETEQRHEEADRREGLFTTRKLLEGPDGLPGRLRLHLDARLHEVVRIGELERGTSATEQLREELLEFLVRQVESVAKTRARRSTQFPDRLPQVFD